MMEEEWLGCAGFELGSGDHWGAWKETVLGADSELLGVSVGVGGNI